MAVAWLSGAAVVWLSGAPTPLSNHREWALR